MKRILQAATLAALLVCAAASAAAGSPDRGEISFWSDRDGDPDVFVMNAAGGAAVNIGRRESGDKRASWSPDGKWIAFDSWFQGIRDFDIWVMRADGSGKRQLTTSPLRDALPAWSPDGRLIAFTRTRANSDVPDIWTIPVAGGVARRVVRNGSGPAWSPDARRIAFSRYAHGQVDVYVVDRDGRRLRRVTTTRTDEDVSAGAWSSDGTWILVTRTPVGGTGDVVAITLDGKRARRLTTAKGRDGDPSWSADGREVLFTSERTGNSDVFVMGADGTAQRNLTRSSAEEYANTWQPLP